MHQLMKLLPAEGGHHASSTWRATHDEAWDIQLEPICGHQGCWPTCAGEQVA